MEIARDHYTVMREVINKLATADCLLSLAHVASQEGYVKAEFTEEDVLEIEDGRHPIIEALVKEPFVPNTVRLGAGSPRSKVITGKFREIRARTAWTNEPCRAEHGRKVVVRKDDGPHWCVSQALQSHDAMRILTRFIVALMAQIGSWVPASRVRMRMLDGIFTRMGGMCDEHRRVVLWRLKASPSCR